MIWAIATLLLLQQEDAVRRLVEELSSEKIEAREKAMQALEEMGRPAIPALEKAARDSDGEVATRARILLFRIPIREHLTPALVHHVKDIYDRLAQGEWIRVFLELAADLRLPDDKRRFPGVRPEDLGFMAPMAARRAETEADRIAVCEAVGRCRLTGTVPELLRYLDGDQVMVRANVAAAIRDSGARDQAAALRRLAADPHPVVRSVAAHALGRLAAKEGAPELVALLGDSSKDVRWWAVRALGDLDAKESLEAVERLASDPDETVRRAAAETAALLRKKS